MYLDIEEIPLEKLKSVFDAFAHLEEEGKREPKLWAIIKPDSKRSKELFERTDVLRELKEALEELYKLAGYEKKVLEPPACDLVGFFQCESLEVAIAFEGKSGKESEGELADQLFSCFLLATKTFLELDKANCKVLLTFSRGKRAWLYYKAASESGATKQERRLERLLKNLISSRKRYRSELLREVVKKGACAWDRALPDREEAMGLLQECLPEG